MRASVAVLSVVLLLLTLWDVFVTIVLPRRVSRAFRFARVFYLITWRPWKAAGRLLPEGKWHEDFLSIYGPLSMLSLLALWAALLLVGSRCSSGGCARLWPRRRPNVDSQATSI
ncbi:MAG: hypothetical protein M3348_08245 [Acidobacteriota bacterium]|nr:hypothetical protein [Acidobacteriota bacterium]